MRPALLAHCVAAAGCTAAVALAASPATFAADAVYGGTSSDGHAVVLKSNATSTTLRAIVLSWRASCDDGGFFRDHGTLTATVAEPGFQPGPDELLVGQNAKGRFKGVQLAGRDLGPSAAVIRVEVQGKLKPGRASGTLKAEVSIVDKATGVAAVTCRAKQTWQASSRPGVVYGGTTSQDAPIVLRLNAARARVSDVYVTWHADCGDGSGWTIPDRLVSFPLKSSGAFGGPFDFAVAPDAGGNRAFDYVLKGKVGKAGSKGTLQVTIAETDAAGAALPNCDTGRLTWKATST